MCALTLRLKLHTTSPTLSVIAQEIALDIADSLYLPDVSEHVAGVANGLADFLSRHEDMKTGVPDLLADATCVAPLARTLSWNIALAWHSS